MKKKTFLRFLPALLVAPILACYITVFATADEIEGQTFYDKVVSPIENAFNKFFMTEEPEISISLDNSFGASLDDGMIRYQIIENPGAETQAWVYSLGSGWGQEQNPPWHEVVIPSTIKYNGQDIYVYGIPENRFIECDMLVQEDTGNTIESIVIKAGDGSGNEGKFTSIPSGAIKGFNNGSFIDEDGEKQYTGGYLKSITLPSTLTSIGAQAFMNDAVLETVYTIYPDDTTTEGLPPNLSVINNRIFMDCPSLTFNKTQQDFVLPENITAIKEFAFARCKSLTGIKFTNGITTIDNNVFESCTHISDVDFTEASSLNIIDAEAFKNCYSISELTLPENTLTLGKGAFLNCYNIDNIKLNNNLQEIGEQCFSNLTSTAASTTASKLEYIFIPESTTRIQKAAFQNSQNLKEVTIGLKNGPDDTESDDIVGESSFANCPSLVSVSFLWDVPWQLYLTSFKYSGTTGIIAATPAIDVRFRPLSDHMAWLKPYWYSKKPLDQIFPDGSKLCITAMFCDGYYGNDLENYLEENGRTQEEIETTGAYDNETLYSYNTSGMLNNVRYKLGVSIPDTVTIDEEYTSQKVMKSKTKGTNSKTIDFVYDNTPVTQTITQETATGTTTKRLTREADDGILNIGNTAIQINVGSKGETTTLNVTRTNKNGTKSNPCIYGHGSSKVSNPFENTYKYLTAEVDQADYNNTDEAAVREPKLNEHEESEKAPGLFAAVTEGSFDMEVSEACCIFCRNNAKLIISDITFGGELYNPITETTTTTENTCQLGCVYNSGAMTMTNCTFTNTTSTWSKEKGPDGKPVSYGGSCVFNFGKNGGGYNTMTGCKMENCSAGLDGGAVLNADKLQITDCTFINCSAGRNGGAVFTNLGDKDKGGLGKHGNLLIDGADKGCSFTNCRAKNGGAIQYRNVLDGELMLTLQGKLSFSGNKDAKGNIDDLYMGPDYTEDPKKQAAASPFVLNGITLFGDNDKITVSTIKPKTGLVLCNNTTPSSVGLFKYQNNNYSIANDDDNIILGGAFPKYSLTAENGTWKDENGNTVETFMTSLEQTTPEAAQTITYKDPDGVSHTLTAVADSADYDFIECAYDSNTQTYTAKFAIPEEQNNSPLLDKIKDSINNRNADAKENAKLEIYGK